MKKHKFFDCFYIFRFFFGFRILRKKVSSFSLCNRLVAENTRHCLFMYYRNLKVKFPKESSIILAIKNFKARRGGMIVKDDEFTVESIWGNHMMVKKRMVILLISIKKIWLILKQFNL